VDGPADVLRRLTTLQKAALLSGENVWQTRAVPTAGVPAIRLADGPHGLRRQLGAADHLGLAASEPATCFPTAATVAGSWDPELAERIGAALGREAAAQGVDVLLGPGLNITRSPLGGRNFEYFSEDPELSGLLAAAYVRGIQSEGVAATPKHFAVNSQELRRMVSDSVVDERTLREIYLTAFEIVVREARPWALMSAYNLVNGTYAHENRHLLTEILRGEWGFDGAVISDWGGGDDPVAAVAGGGTLEMPSPGFDSARAIVAAVERGDLDVADLDARVIELLRLVERVTARGAPGEVDAAAHDALARRAAAESAVLLRNTDAILPLAPGTRVALIGDFVTEPRFQGAGSSLVNPTRVANLRDAVAATELVTTAVAQGFRRDEVPDAALVAEAVGAARDADLAVLMLGLPEIADAEGLDRSTLAIPADQIALLRAVATANPRTVVVLSAGGVIETGPWIDDAAALLHAYLGGQAGADAIADLLTGAAAPSGRLAETFPRALADGATARTFPSAARTAEYREGLYVGYRFFDSAGVDVAFPFGFGLTYTTFAYANLRATPDEVRIEVTNTGSRASAEVVQVYVGRRSPSVVHRPRRELKAFAKVRLEPGETRDVVLTLGSRGFRHFDVSAGAWAVEAGGYDIHVGPNVRDIEHVATVTVDGGETTASGADEVAAYRTADVRDVSDADFAALLGRPIPSSHWPVDRLGVNDPIDRLHVARSRVVRAIFRLVERRHQRALRAGRPDLNVVFVFNAPFRAISKMSGSRTTHAVTDAVLFLVNGHTFRGAARVVAAYVRGRRDERATREEFRRGRRSPGPS